MLKLLKYEFVKKSKFYLVLAAFAVIANLVLGIAFGEGGMGIFLGLFPIVLVIVYTYELVKNFSDDLNKKTGYMIFLTPNSGYTIIGSKLIYTLLTALIFFISYIILLVINVSIIAIIESSLSEFIEVTKMLIQRANEALTTFVGVNIGDLMAMLLMILSAMVVFTLTVYSSITLRKSIFSDIKFGGLISFIIFIILNLIIGHGTELISKSLDTTRLITQITSVSSFAYPSAYMLKLTLLSSAYNLVVCILLMLGSGYLLEHKINL